MDRNDYSILMSILYNNILWDDFKDNNFIS
jgi:hypothetical protein